MYFIRLNYNRRNGSVWQVVNDLETETIIKIPVEHPLGSGMCWIMSPTVQMPSHSVSAMRSLAHGALTDEECKRCLSQMRGSKLLNFLENTSLLFWKLRETIDGGLFRHRQSSRLSKSNRCVFDPLVDPRNTVVVTSQTPLDPPPTPLRPTCVAGRIPAYPA